MNNLSIRFSHLDFISLFAKLLFFMTCKIFHYFEDGQAGEISNGLGNEDHTSLHEMKHPHWPTTEPLWAWLKINTLNFSVCKNNLAQPRASYGVSSPVRL